MKYLRFAIFLALIFCATVSITLALPNGLKLQDFFIFMASGKAASEGENPYATDLIPPFRANGVLNYRVNMNLPLTLFLFRPMSRFNPVILFRAVGVISVLLYAGCVLLLWRAFPPVINPLRFAWLLAFAPLWMTIAQGQICMIFGALAIGAWILLKNKNHVCAGYSIGLLVAIKPNFAVWPVLLLFGGYASVGLTAVVVALFLSSLPVLFWGKEIYLQYFSLLTSNAAPWNGYAANASLPGLFTRFGLPILGTFVCAVLILILILWAFHRQPSDLELTEAGLLASLLASPIAWATYLVVLLPIFLSRNRWSWQMIVAAGILALPIDLILSACFDHPSALPTIGSLHNVALLLVSADLVLPAWLLGRAKQSKSAW